jgi:hypothetical protein
MPNRIIEAHRVYGFVQVSISIYNSHWISSSCHYVSHTGPSRVMVHAGIAYGPIIFISNWPIQVHSVWYSSSVNNIHNSQWTSTSCYYWRRVHHIGSQGIHGCLRYDLIISLSFFNYILHTYYIGTHLLTITGMHRNICCKSYYSSRQIILRELF